MIALKDGGARSAGIVSKGEADRVVLPHSLIAEQEIIGGILYDNNLINKVRESLSVHYFYSKANAKIYDLAVRLIDKGKVADVVSISSNLINDEMFAEIGGTNYLKNAISDFLVSVSDLSQRGKTVRDLFLKRNLIEILMGYTRDIMLKTEVELTTTDQIENLERDLFKLTEGNLDTASGGGFMSLKSALQLTKLRMEKAQTSDGISGIDTGFVDLNEKLHGWQNSDLIIIAGRPSMGKTSLAISVAVNAAQKLMQKHKKDLAKAKPGTAEIKPPSVGIFSLEMSSEQISSKILAIQSEQPTTEFIGGKIDESMFNKLMQTIPQIQDIPIYIDDTPALSISAIRTRARRLKQRHGLDMLIVDYLQLVRGSAKNAAENRVQEVSEVTQGLKAIAKELNIPVIALSQLSRSVESREDKHPQLSDLRESGSIEQDADVVMFIYRESYYLSRTMPPESQKDKYEEWLVKNGEKYQNSKNTAEIIVAKHRNGEIGTVLLHFNEETTKFGNLASSNKQHL